MSAASRSSGEPSPTLYPSTSGSRHRSITSPASVIARTEELTQRVWFPVTARDPPRAGRARRSAAGDHGQDVVGVALDLRLADARDRSQRRWPSRSGKKSWPCRRTPSSPKNTCLWSQGRIANEPPTGFRATGPLVVRSKHDARIECSDYCSFTPPLGLRLAAPATTPFTLRRRSSRVHRGLRQREMESPALP